MNFHLCELNNSDSLTQLNFVKFNDTENDSELLINELLNQNLRDSILNMI